MSAPHASEARKTAARAKLHRARRRIWYGYWASGGLIIAAVGLALVSHSTAHSVLAVVCSAVAVVNLWTIHRFLRRFDAALAKLSASELDGGVEERRPG